MQAPSFRGVKRREIFFDLFRTKPRRKRFLPSVEMTPESSNQFQNEQYYSITLTDKL